MALISYCCLLINNVLCTAMKYKKLSYCCDSRSHCMQQYDRLSLKQLLPDIYFNAIHCDRSVSTCEYKTAELS